MLMLSRGIENEEEIGNLRSDRLAAMSAYNVAVDRSHLILQRGGGW